MRGHVVKRGKSSYSIVVSLGRDAVTGKPKQQWESVKGTKKDAEKRLAELLHQLDTGSFMKPGKVTVAEFLNRWLLDYGRPNLTPRSLERYQSIVRVHLIPGLGNVTLTQLAAGHLQQLYSDKMAAGLQPRTVRYVHVVLHKALQTALKWGLIHRNVADGVDIPRPRRTEMHVWDAEQIKTFLQAAEDTPYFGLFHAALFTGMRRSELLALRWKDMELLLGQVSVSRGVHHLRDGSYVFTQPKSARSRRTIALPPSAVLVLQQHYEECRAQADLLGRAASDDDLVFCHIDGKPLRPETVSRAWQNLAARCGLPAIRFHDARHSHATLLLKQGVHPKIVQERLGHSSIAITLDTYSHVAPGLQAAAAARFDEAFAGSYNSLVGTESR